jgi:ribulose 1,5-bisphosphate synthetase/thiazole synthase
MVFNRTDLMEATGKILEENGIRYPYSSDLRAVWEAPTVTKKSAQAACCAPAHAAN